MDGTDNFVPGGVIVVMQIYLLIIQNVTWKPNCGMEIAILPFLKINYLLFLCAVNIAYTIFFHLDLRKIIAKHTTEIYKLKLLRDSKQYKIIFSC